jgi:hypothetical protein
LERQIVLPECNRRQFIERRLTLVAGWQPTASGERTFYREGAG